MLSLIFILSRSLSYTVCARACACWRPPRSHLLGQHYRRLCRPQACMLSSVNSGSICTSDCSLLVCRGSPRPLSDPLVFLSSRSSKTWSYSYLILVWMAACRGDLARPTSAAQNWPTLAQRPRGTVCSQSHYPRRYLSQRTVPVHVHGCRFIQMDGWMGV